MNRKLINFVDMLKAVLQFYVEHPELLTENPSLQLAVDKVNAFVNQFAVLDNAQAEDKEGLVELKKETRNTLIVNVQKVSSAVKAYATSIADSVLKRSVDFPDTYFSHMRDHVLLQQARCIYEIAFPIKDKLGTWTTSSDDVEAINTNSDVFEAKDPAIKNIKSRTKKASDDLLAKQTEANNYLKETLDVYMKPLKYSNPSLHGQYENARTIVNIAGAHGKTKTKTDSTDTSTAAETK